MFISKITLPNGNTYELKDLGARELIEELSNAGLKFMKSTDAATTPVGVQWKDGETVITGTLLANAANHAYIYMVPDSTSTGNSRYIEFITMNVGTDADPNWVWEALGTTDIDIDDLGDLAYKDAVNIVKGTGDNVLGEATVFTNSSSAVTFTGGTNDTFVKSYPGSKQKLATTSIVGTNGTESVSKVTATEKTATNTVFGTDTVASKITIASKTATNLVLAENTKASKATAGTAVTLAKPAAAATAISRVGDAETTSILKSATVTNETLSFGTAAVTQGNVTGINGSQSITPYTFADVDVPVVTSNTPVTFNAVSTNNDVTVPVVDSNDEVKVDKVAITNVNVAKVAASATVVATGKTAATDASGDEVMIGLGNATTASAVTGIGTGTAAAQTITVGNQDRIKIAKYDDLDVSVE